MVLATEIAGPADALKRLAASRDADAWAWLLAETGPEIHRVAMRLIGDAATADDAVQECLLTLRDHAGGFHARSDPDRDAMRWIVRVAANAALQVRRGRRRAADRDRRQASAQPARIADPVGADLERDETARMVRDELSRLGESERAAIVLHVVAGMSFDQVAAELRCPVGTAKVRVHRGLERLRRRLGRRANDLSIASLLASLQQGDPVMGSLAHHVALLGSPAHAAAHTLPITIGALTMATKLAITATVLLAVAAPLAMQLRSQEPSPIVAPANVPADAPAPAAPVLSMADLLNRKVSFEFMDTPLDEAADFFRAMGVPCRWDDLGKARLTLKVKDMRTRDAVRWIAELSGASMKVADGAIVLFRTLADQRVLLDQSIELPLSTLTVDEALEVVRLATGVAISETAGTDTGTKVTLASGTRKAGDIIADIAQQSGNPLRIEASGVSFGPFAPAGVPLAQAPAAVAASLAQTVTLDFSETDLVDAVMYLRRITDLNILLDPQVITMQLKSMTMKADSRPLSEVIEAIAAVNGLTVQYRDQALFITIGEPEPKAPTHSF